MFGPHTNHDVESCALGEVKASDVYFDALNKSVCVGKITNENLRVAIGEVTCLFCTVVSSTLSQAEDYTVHVLQRCTKSFGHRIGYNVEAFISFVKMP